MRSAFLEHPRWLAIKSARAAQIAMLCFLALLAAGAISAAYAQNPASEQDIRNALTEWTDRFNDRKASEICDLFATDLVYDYRGFPSRDYQAICGLLKRSLEDPQRRYRYLLKIHEILTFGNIAVVRLTWTLRVSSQGQANESVAEEPGMDIFRREADGRWRIFRYIAYEAP